MMRLAHTALAIFGCLILAAFTGRFSWWGDLIATLLDYWLLPVVLLVAIYAWRRAWVPFGIGMLLLLLGATYLLVFPRAATLSDGGEPDLRLMVFNMYYDNREIEALTAEIRAYDPDIIFLMEYANPIRAEIEAEFEDYVHTVIEPSRRTMGLALFSRVPLEDATVHRAADTRIPIYDIDFEIDGEMVTFIGAHPWPPDPRWAGLNREQIRDVVEIAEANADLPLIVAGDFNAPPAAYMMRELARRSETGFVRGWFDNSKTFFLGNLIRLPLDHILVSDQWVVTHFEYGDRVGSDHLPLIIDLRLADG